MWVCHETIYRSLYAQHHGVLRKDLWRCLRTRRAVRTPRGGHRRGRGQGVIKDPVMISARPRVVETRTRWGHWEGDLGREPNNGGSYPGGTQDPVPGDGRPPRETHR